MKKILLSGCIALALSANSFADPKISVEKYLTADQMLLANELNESGEPFAETLGYNLDDLDPMVPGAPDVTAYTLGIENYEYSRYHLGTIITRSGMGLHMMWAPMIRQMAAKLPDSFDGSMTAAPNGFKEDDVLVQMIKSFAQLSHHAPPGNPWPQFAEFVAGDPHLPQAVDPLKFHWEDFSTLRWDRDKMDKRLNPAAMGQALMKQYLWAQDMLSGYHDIADNPIEPTLSNAPDPAAGIYLGGDSLDGFIGQVITAEAINKIAFMTQKLAYDGHSLGAIDLMHYDPAHGVKYFPHLVNVTEKKVHPLLPPQVDSLQVDDDKSDLFDQASLLWGTSNFTNMMDPNDNSSSAHLAYHQVFDGSPFPAPMSVTGVPGPFDLMKGTSRAVFLDLLAMHLDKIHHSFVDQAELDDGKITRIPKITTVNAAYLIIALEPFIHEFANTPLGVPAKQALTEQATYIVDHLYNGHGGFASKGNINANTAVYYDNIEDQAAAIHALYVAYRVTQVQKFRDVANSGYEYMLANYYLPNKHLFRTSLNGSTAVYTPKNVAIISGALREASMTGGMGDAASVYTDFFQTVADKMQMSEDVNTGETGGDSDADGIPYIPEQPDRVPQIFASKAVFSLK